MISNEELQHFVDREIDTWPDSTLAELAKELLSTRKTLESLRKLMGYVQNGSDETVYLFQDDATMDFMLRVGNKTYWGNYLEQVIDKAFEAERPRK